MEAEGGGRRIGRKTFVAYADGDSRYGESVRASSYPGRVGTQVGRWLLLVRSAPRRDRSNTDGTGLHIYEITRVSPSRVVIKYANGV